MTVVLVDAENVRRSRWPNIPPAELVELARTWATARDVRVVVVFDGGAPGGALGERRIDERCVVVGTARESADEWIERRAAELHAHGERYWLATSDRALRARAGASAERVVGGGSLARDLAAGA